MRVRGNRRAALIAALAGLGLLATAPSASAAATFELSWGNTNPLSGPHGAATDAAGRLYVADGGNNRIVKYTPSGTVLNTFDGGSGGTYPGLSPADVAVDSAGRMYVADGIRVVKLSAAGNFIKEWGPYGGPVDPFNYDFGPGTIEIDSAGNVYVGDCATPRHRIQKFDANGNFILEWGDRGTADSEFECPSGLGIDSQDNVYVVDNGNDRIQKFDDQGTLLAKWGQNGTANGRFVGPTGLTVDASDNVYVADRYNSRIQQFSSAGVFIRKWGTPGTDAGQFVGPADVAAGPGGVLYVTDTDGGSVSRVQKFNSTGGFLAGWGGLTSGNGQFDTPLGVATAPDGTVYVSDTNRDRVQRFDADGAFLGRWGSTGTANRQFNRPTGITVAADGNVYVIDSGNSRVQVFTPTGAFVRKWGTAGSGARQFQFFDPAYEQPNGIATDSAGNVYVTDANRVQKFTATGTFLTQWGSYGTADGEFTGAAGIAVDSLDNVYVTSLAYRFDVQKFDSDGDFIDKWGAEGSSEGEFGTPTGIAIDANDIVFVADSPYARIQKFATDGTFLELWGEPGLGNDEFQRPVTVAAGSAGAVYVADSDVHRIQKFTVDDSVAPPDPPTDLSVDPASPGTSLTPKIIGTAEAGTKVRIYTDALCSGAFVAEGSAAIFGGAGIPVTVASGSTTTFYATATNLVADVTSSCSTSSVTYTHEPPTLTIADALARGEGSAASRFDVTLSIPSDQTVMVDYATVDGSATAPGDYTAKTGTLVFAPGQTTKPVLVSSTDDALDEASETFQVQLSSPVAATIDDGTGDATILDNDASPALTIADAVARVEGGPASRFDVTLSVPSGQTVMVGYATVDGSATAPADYTAKSGTLVFLPGQTTKAVLVSSVDDALDEPNQTFRVQLSSPVAATIADPSGLATILDNDP